MQIKHENSWVGVCQFGEKPVLLSIKMMYLKAGRFLLQSYQNMKIKHENSWLGVCQFREEPVLLTFKMMYLKAGRFLLQSYQKHENKT
jgi:hypothetical protein